MSVVRLPRLAGLVGFVWFAGGYAISEAQRAWRDRACTTTIAQRLALPMPHREVEVQVHRCPTEASGRPGSRWQAWAVSAAPGLEGRRMLIELSHQDTMPAVVRWDAQHGVVIERFRWSDVLDWEHGRGEGYVPTTFLFIDNNDEGRVVRSLP